MSGINIAEFIPEIWSARILTNLNAGLVFAGLCNTNYEGDITKAGDTVHITTFGRPSVHTYTPNDDIQVDPTSADTTALEIDQLDYFSFEVDDVEKKQALAGWVEEVTREASYSLAEATDGYVSGLMDSDANDDLDGATISSAGDAYELLVGLRTVLTKENVPYPGRWATVPPEFYAALLQDQRFIDASASADAGAALRNGLVGRAAGFDVYESNTTPSGDTVIAGHPIATTYASQILSVESQRRELRFGDLVKGLHVYGAKVIRPEALAKSQVTINLT